MTDYNELFQTPEGKAALIRECVELLRAKEGVMGFPGPRTNHPDWAGAQHVALFFALPYTDTTSREWREVLGTPWLFESVAGLARNYLMEEERRADDAAREARHEGSIHTVT